MRILARTEAPLAATASELAGESGRKVVAVVADTTDDDQVARAIGEAVRQLGGGIDILVNAAAEPAGYAAPPRLAEITGAFYHREMDIKVMGYLRCAREVAPHMQAQGWGRIVNISGLAARQSGNTVGSMRNVSVAALTKNLADELGPSGINVTVVHPGLTRTERTAALVAPSGPHAGHLRERHRAADGRRQLDPAPRRRGRGGPCGGFPGLAEVDRDQRRRDRRRRRRAAQHPLLRRERR